MRHVVPLGGRRERTQERVGQFPSRGDLQLAIDAPEVHLDGLAGQEQPLGDLAVAPACGGRISDAALGGSKRIRTRESLAPRAGSGDVQFLAGVVRELHGTQAPGEHQRFGERRSCRTASAGVPEGPADGELGPAELSQAR